MNTNLDLIRAWKDEQYRASLSEAELAMLPQNPAGDLLELSDEELSMVEGGSETAIVCSIAFTIISASLSAAASMAVSAKYCAPRQN